MNITDTIDKYIRLRDLKAKLDSEHKDKVAPIVEAMTKGEAAILRFFQENGMDSAGSPNGTAYKTTKTSATVADRDAFFAWVRENDAYHMLESRVAKTQVDEFVKANGDLPPGVNYNAVVAINVRRS